MGIANCRSCGGDDLHIILDLGSQPISNALLSQAELDLSEMRFPLAVAFCPACALLQVTETVPPDVFYRRDCLYFSSSSPAQLKHSAEHHHLRPAHSRCHAGRRRVPRLPAIVGQRALVKET
jgi:hypothetical protein